MIAEEVDGLVDRERMIQQMVEDATRGRAAIDIVAEIDHGGVHRAPPAQILDDHRLERDQQVQTTMDVADGIDAPALIDHRGDLKSCT